MLKIFGMHKGGKEYRRLVPAFERIYCATIFSARTKQHNLHINPTLQVQFLAGSSNWQAAARISQECLIHSRNVIVLSDEFDREISEHPI